MNVLSKGNLPVVEGCDIQFITGIGGTVARDDCAAVTVKCSTHNS